ncbi:putative coat protein [Impatiens cryptic virus 1]|nr:putative coat protein [Impatiens cryptic virus 1]
MSFNAPPAMPDGPSLQAGPVPPANPPQHISAAPPAPGVVQTPAAPAARRPRAPLGPITRSSSSGIDSAPAMLEISAAYPYSTIQRRSPNLFVPDAQMLFHVLGICDQLMDSTDRFLRSSPAWLPIISQLYIAVLWNVMILRVHVTSGYGPYFAQLYNDMVNHLQITECMIPGPLIPFFQSLAAINGPFDWMGDILAAMPDFASAWDATNFQPQSNVARILPVPAILLDQLYAFSQFPVEANTNSSYTTFQWYRSIFARPVAAHGTLVRLGPQLCGSLFTTQSQHDAARSFWHSCLTNNFTRVNATQAPFVHHSQLLGFISQTGTQQIPWFQHVTTVMQKYAQYFNGSAPLKSVLPVGIGAVAIIGQPLPHPDTRNWLYPTAAMVEPFGSNHFLPRREIPSNLRLMFGHADHNLEEQAEQYATLTCTNIIWSAGNAEQNDHARIHDENIRTGAYWTMEPYRLSPTVGLKSQYAQVIASRYHQQAANRVD